MGSIGGGGEAWGGELAAPEVLGEGGGWGLVGRGGAEIGGRARAGPVGEDVGALNLGLAGVGGQWGLGRPADAELCCGGS